MTRSDQGIKVRDPYEQTAKNLYSDASWIDGDQTLSITMLSYAHIDRGSINEPSDDGFVRPDDGEFMT